MSPSADSNNKMTTLMMGTPTTNFEDDDTRSQLKEAFNRIQILEEQVATLLRVVSLPTTQTKKIETEDGNAMVRPATVSRKPSAGLDERHVDEHMTKQNQAKEKTDVTPSHNTTMSDTLSRAPPQRSHHHQTNTSSSSSSRDGRRSKYPGGSALVPLASPSIMDGSKGDVDDTHQEQHQEQYQKKNGTYNKIGRSSTRTESSSMVERVVLPKRTQTPIVNSDGLLPPSIRGGDWTPFASLPGGNDHLELSSTTSRLGMGTVAENSIQEESEYDLHLERSDESLVKASKAEAGKQVEEDEDVKNGTAYPKISAENLRTLPREIGFDDASSKASDSMSSSLIGANNQYVDAVELNDVYKLAGTYTGTIDITTGLPDGKGIMKYHHKGKEEGQRIYEGDWVKGKWHGRGKIRNGGGDMYFGDVSYDKKAGNGKIVFDDGRVLTGKFQNDYPIEGTIVYPDKSRYVGQFKSLDDGASSPCAWAMITRDGQGCYYFIDGSFFEGTFKDDHFHKGTMTWPDGGWAIGEWNEKNEMHGKGKEIRSDGTLRHDGLWDRGQPIR